MSKWGIKIKDDHEAEKIFKQIDKDNGGKILFN